MRELRGQLTAAGKTFGVVVSRFNEFVTRRLLEGCLDCLRRHGADEERIDIVWVPGSFEIPYAARTMAESKRYDAVICLGAVVRGSTPHFEYIASEVAKGVAQTALQTGVPTIFGVITAETLEDAIERAGAKAGNRGWDAAMSAVEMADLYTQL